MVKRIPIEELKRDIQKIVKRIGYVPNSNEYRKLGKYSYDAQLFAFDSYHQAIKAAGYSPDDIKNNMSVMAKKRGVPFGEKSPHWKGGWTFYYGPNMTSQARKARERACFKCQRCRISEDEIGKSLDIHHIIPFKYYNYIPEENDNYKLANSLNNLEALCPSCHMITEWRDFGRKRKEEKLS